MTDLNEVRLIGRVVRDAKLETKGDLKYSTFSIAVNHDAKNEKGEYVSFPTFVDLAIFNNYAEKFYQFLKQGTLIHVSGTLTTRTWIKNDEKRSELGVSVQKIQLLSSKHRNSEIQETNIEQSSSLENYPTELENKEPENSEELTAIF